MNAEQKKMLAMAAHMDREQAIARDIGKTVGISQMELIALVNFAEIGVMSIFSGIEGEEGEDAERELEEHLDAIRREFGRNDDSGLSRLMQTTAALLRGRFQKYLTPRHK